MIPSTPQELQAALDYWHTAGLSWTQHLEILSQTITEELRQDAEIMSVLPLIRIGKYSFYDLEVFVNGHGKSMTLSGEFKYSLVLRGKDEAGSAISYPIKLGMNPGEDAQYKTGLIRMAEFAFYVRSSSTLDQGYRNIIAQPFIPSCFDRADQKVIDDFISSLDGLGILGKTTALRLTSMSSENFYISRDIGGEALIKIPTPRTGSGKFTAGLFGDGQFKNSSKYIDFHLLSLYNFYYMKSFLRMVRFILNAILSSML